ncbi:hypothetical protein ACXGQW_08030 [Wenyingzhuangia sp. IMCC45533]
MKLYIKSLYVMCVSVLIISCSKDRTISTTELISEGLSTVVFSGDITNEQAAEMIKNDIGRNTNTILVQNTKNLTTLNVKGLEKAVSILVSRNEKLESIAFPDLNEVFNNITISNSDVLKTVDLRNLSESSAISISRLSLLETINLDNLKNSVGRITLFSCNSLLAFSLPNLKSIDFGGLQVRDNESLREINAEKLEFMNGSLDFSDNLALEKMNFDSLSELTSIRLLRSRISSLSCPEIEYMSGPLIIMENELLEEILLPKFKKVGIKDFPELEARAPVYNITGNPVLKALNFPNLEGTIKMLAVNNNELSSVVFSKINSNITSDITIIGNSVEEVDFGGLSTFRLFSVNSKTEIENLNLSSSTSFNTIAISSMKEDQIGRLLDGFINNAEVGFKSVTLTGVISAENMEKIESLEDKKIRFILNP